MTSPQSPVVADATVRRLRASGPSEAQTDDGALVARAVRGDRWAEEMLYRRHAPGLLDLLTRLLARSGEAEDAVQDAFVAALGELGRLREPGRFRPWLFQIGVRQAHRRYRRRALRRRLGLDGEADDATLAELVDHRASPEIRVELGKIDRVLRSVRLADRTAWILRYVEGYRYPEIAEVTGCSEATAKRRAERALGHVHRALSIRVEEPTHG